MRLQRVRCDCHTQSGKPIYNVILERGSLLSSTHIHGRLLLFAKNRYGILVNGFSVFLSVRRCKKPDLQNFLLKIFNYLKATSASFLSIKCLILIFTLSSFHVVL